MLKIVIVFNLTRLSHYIQVVGTAWASERLTLVHVNVIGIFLWAAKQRYKTEYETE